MIRGTTPIHIFHTDVDLTTAEVIYVTYTQGTTVVEKTKDDCEVEEDTVTVHLTQEETLQFKAGGYTANVQIRARYADGTALASNIISIDISRILKNGVI